MKYIHREANSSSAIQEIACIVLNPRVDYRAHNSSTHIPILRQMNEVHAFQFSPCPPIQSMPSNPISLISILISSHLCLGLLSGLFP